MKKLYELFALKACKGDVGVEIECEGRNLTPIMDATWTTEADNSLRGGFPHEACEWVFSKPVPIRDVLPALQQLEDVQKKSKAVFDFSFRTSVHVHVNVQQLSVDQISNLIYTYFLCETVMMNHVNQSRRGNRFCLRMEDAEGMVDYITKMIRAPEGDWKMLNPHDAIRYSAMNIEALWKYGSIEFRGMEGNMDVNRIYNWCKAFVNMREFAKQFPNVQFIHDFFVKNSPERFFKAALGDVAEIYTYEGYVHDLRKGFSLAIDIPYSYRKREQQEGKKLVTTRVEGIINVIQGEVAVDWEEHRARIINAPRARPAVDAAAWAQFNAAPQIFRRN